MRKRETSAARTEAVQKPNRVLTLDLLRGFFLVTMILDHLAYWPNTLSFLTARGQLFVSGAEGFFIISGIVLGIVRGRKLIEKPMSVASKLLLSRALKLYVTYVVAVLFFTFIGWLFIANPGLKYGILPPGTSVFEIVWKTLTFQYIYGWADYLRLYVLFLVASPLVVWLLRKNKWWIVMGASILIWLLAPRPAYPDNVALQPLHWQLLFFGGMTAGFYFDAIKDRFMALRPALRRAFLAGIVSITVLAMAGNAFLALGGDLSTAVFNVVVPLREALSVPFDKENLPLPRLLFALGYFISTYWLFTRFEPFIQKYLGRFLLPLGLNSLYVYTVQAFVIFFVHLIVPSGNTGFVINVIFTYATLILIWAMVRYKVLFNVIPR